MTVTVDVWNDCVTDAVPADATLQAWAEIAVRAARSASGVTTTCTPKPVSLSIRVVDNDESASLNQAYRQRDYATNVLSFRSDLPDDVLQALDEQPLGDLVICAPVVSAEALEQHKPEQAHWAHMLVHGVLHLHGFDHETDADADTMETLETDILAELGFPDPYRES